MGAPHYDWFKVRNGNGNGTSDLPAEALP